MERLALIGGRAGARPAVSIRINPDFELKSSGMRMGGGSKPFGVDAERVPDMLARLSRLALGFRGFHIFSGSQNIPSAALSAIQDTGTRSTRTPSRTSCDLSLHL